MRGIARCVSVGLMGVSALVQAATVVWNNGAGTFRWRNPTNWVGGVAPGPADGVVFDGTVSQDPCIADTVSDNLGALILTNG